MKLRQLLKRRDVRWTLIFGPLAALALFFVLSVWFLAVASGKQREFRQIEDPVSPELAIAIGENPKYRRSESASYLTFTEWYMVFNPQEYADFIRVGRPSQFPYFKSIGQIWGGYAEIYGATRRAYPTNLGKHFATVMLGGSGTLEFAVKGCYESTIGRLSEWMVSGIQTAEDEYAAQIAKEYGEFVPTLPFFEFPFGRAFTELWSKTPFFGPNFTRKLERKLFLSVEYGFKAGYSAIFRIGSRSIYGVADTEIYLSILEPPDSVFANPSVKKIRQLNDGSWIITLPHYQGFTDTAPLIARQGADFVEVAGNDEMLISFIAPMTWSYDLTGGRKLFTQDLLNTTGKKRVVAQAPIRSLGRMLREIEAKGLRVEHLFDY